MNNPNWFFSDQKLSLISGPCSAESEEQLLSIAEQLAKNPCVSYMRAGIWKPRTMPGGFEGYGEDALKWLKVASEEYTVKTAVEVATPTHIELALKYDVDLIWVGARTTGNPFSVQELADALQGVNVPVLVKNPMNPDVKLWLGAIERLQRSGVIKVGGVHRGFSSYNQNIYRNEPMWTLPIEFMRHFPNLPLLCDPSHIAGRRDLIHSVCQQALDLGMSGLMIETHHNPSHALTDAMQQITPSELENLIHTVSIRKSNVTSKNIQNQLEKLREQIDKIDHELFYKIMERIKLVEQIGQYKAQNNIQVLQMERWNEIIQDRTELGKILEIHPDFVEQLLDLIHIESIRKQTQIMSEIKTKPGL